jgi:hypothetical protein
MANPPITATSRPEPVLSEARVSALVSNAVAIAVAFGFIGTAEGGQITTAALGVYAAVAAAVSVASHLVTAYRARGKVTPTVDPRDDAGHALVPAGTGGTVYDQGSDGLGAL